MPTPAEQLTVRSTKAEKDAAVSECISMMIKEHPNMKQDQAVAACNAMARKAMGHGSTKAE